MTAITIEPVDDLDCRVVSYDWPFAKERATDIAVHWEAQLAKGRQLWNGRVLVAHDPQILVRDGQRIFRADHFETSFAAFLAFRDWGFPDPSVRNCFAMAALRAADGPFLLARMAAHTANAGRVYFAAGTPDPDDIRGDRLDLAGSVMRELTEETGIVAADVESTPGYTIVREGGRIACMKELRTREPAEATVTRVSQFLASETNPELDGLVVVRGEADLTPDTMPDFILAYLRNRLAAD